MNGVFKFKENLFLKYKKEIALTAFAVLTMATVVKFVPASTNTETQVSEEETNLTATVEEVVPVTGYNVTLDGAVIGVIESYDEGQAAVNKAIELAIGELGYNPEVEPTIELSESYALDGAYATIEDLSSVLKDYILNNITEVKVKAFVMKIGDDFTIAVESEEAIKEVLKNAQSMYMHSDEMAIDISLARDMRNSLVMTPQVVMVKEEDMADRSFTAEGDPVVTSDTAGDTQAETTEEQTSDDTTETSDTTETTTEETEPTEPLDPKTDGVTVAIDFAEEVMIVEAYVDEDSIHDVEEATALITKENDEPKLYTVVSGDVPSIIAENNDMGLSDLYDMNPGLKENATKMQIGDQLIVMVPEPELSVATKDEVVYTEPIARGTVYVDNPDKYKGSNSVVDSGYDGVKQLTAIVSKVNGEEIDREIIGEEVIKEPKDKVISQGSKPLPAKGATGNYITPLVDYRITSPFGYRWGGFHYGVDMAAPTGTSVRASDGGTVTIAGWYGNYGYLVEIDHGNGVRTRYGHNSKILVSVGQEVSQYQEIAKVGSTGRSTGPHVHFEIRFDGVCANPMNYLDY